jgi:hypothetical protein
MESICNACCVRELRGARVTRAAEVGAHVLRRLYPFSCEKVKLMRLALVEFRTKLRCGCTPCWLAVTFARNLSHYRPTVLVVKLSIGVQLTGTQDYCDEPPGILPFHQGRPMTLAQCRSMISPSRSLLYASVLLARLIPLAQVRLYVVGAARGTGRRVCEDCLA